MSKARVRLPAELDGLLRSELMICIQEANLGDVDEKIANRYLLQQIPQIEIAAEMDWTRTTMSHHIGRIMRKILFTARKLNLI